ARQWTLNCRSGIKKAATIPPVRPLTDYMRLWYIPTVIEVRLNDVLEAQGRTLYWLWKRSGVRYATVWKMSRGEIGRLNIEFLDGICEALGCQPGDLLVRVSNTKSRKRGK